VIILDTNVVSALMRLEIDTTVVEWLNDQPLESIWTTAVTVFEAAFGLEILAAGRRRRQLEHAFQQMLQDDLEGRILPFEQSAAREAARLSDRQRQVGRPIEIRDAQIAGIVAARHATLATRNMRHFDDLGIALIDPWEARSGRVPEGRGQM
jgi:predicted nucleic acid-binding protein